MNALTRYLLIGIVSASLVAPAQALDLRLWVYAFSERTRTAIYLGAASVVAGVGLLAYKLWCKKKVQPEEPEVKEEPVSQMVEMQAAWDRLKKFKEIKEQR